MKKSMILVIVLAILSTAPGCMFLIHPDHDGHHDGKGRGSEGGGSGKGGRSH